MTVSTESPVQQRTYSKVSHQTKIKKKFKGDTPKLYIQFINPYLYIGYTNHAWREYKKSCVTSDKRRLLERAGSVLWIPSLFLKDAYPLSQVQGQSLNRTTHRALYIPPAVWRHLALLRNLKWEPCWLSVPTVEQKGGCWYVGTNLLFSISFWQKMSKCIL